MGPATGILLILSGAFASGSFGLALKYTRWKWEHIWLIYSCFGMVLIPWWMALLTVPDVRGVLAAAGARQAGLVLLYGMGWGIGAVLYGLALRMAGLAISYAIVMGLTAAVGSLAPLVLLHPNELSTARGRLVIGGVALIVAGVALSAWAGRLKGRIPAGKGENVALGVFVAILSGLLSPMLNLSFAYGGPLAKSAVERGASPLYSANVIWAVALSGGFVANAAYCLWLIARGGAWRALAGPAREYGLAAAMALLWSAGYIFYGIGGSALGEMAAVIGWPLMSSMSILSANLWGAVAGEWAGSGARPRALMLAAVVLLCVGMWIIGRAQ